MSGKLNTLEEPFTNYGEGNWSPIILVHDDSLITSKKDVGEWAEKKYNLVGRYCDIFTKSMHRKWNHLVYIDLFAGSGYTRFRNSKKIIRSSPLIALSLPIPFSEYIFCEKDPELCNALRTRVKRDFADKNVTIIEGDCNEKIDKIISHIPKYSKSNTVLSFSFVDPFSLNLDFLTIEKLGMYAMDFLILLALGMDANRNMETYLNSSSDKISKFLNDKDWREKFNKNHSLEHASFVQFLAKEYKKNIERIKYKSPEDFHEIRSTDKNLPLYHLAFFSKHNLGNDFWKKVQGYSDGQQKLF
ncbi:MAG: three-Cys-motif partner protein TcmP [Bacteroidota bacterium]